MNSMSFDIQKELHAAIAKRAGVRESLNLDKAEVVDGSTPPPPPPAQTENTTTAFQGGQVPYDPNNMQNVNYNMNPNVMMGANQAPGVATDPSMMNPNFHHQPHPPQSFPQNQNQAQFNNNVYQQDPQFQQQQFQNQQFQNQQFHQPPSYGGQQTQFPPNQTQAHNNMQPPVMGMQTTTDQFNPNYQQPQFLQGQFDPSTLMHQQPGDSQVVPNNFEQPQMTQEDQNAVPQMINSNPIADMQPASIQSSVQVNPDVSLSVQQQQSDDVQSNQPIQAESSLDQPQFTDGSSQPINQPPVDTQNTSIPPPTQPYPDLQPSQDQVDTTHQPPSEVQPLSQVPSQPDFAQEPQSLQQEPTDSNFQPSQLAQGHDGECLPIQLQQHDAQSIPVETNVQQFPSTQGPSPSPDQINPPQASMDQPVSEVQIPPQPDSTQVQGEMSHQPLQEEPVDTQLVAPNLQQPQFPQGQENTGLPAQSSQQHDALNANPVPPQPEFQQPQFPQSQMMEPSQSMGQPQTEMNLSSSTGLPQMQPEFQQPQFPQDQIHPDMVNALPNFQQQYQQPPQRPNLLSAKNSMIQSHRDLYQSNPMQYNQMMSQSFRNLYPTAPLQQYQQHQQPQYPNQQFQSQPIAEEEQISPFIPLYQSIRSKGKSNLEKLRKVESNMKKEVIQGYKHVLECEIGPDAPSVAPGKEWTLRTVATTEIVGNLVKAWSYKGEALEKDHLVDCNFDLSMKKYSDVVRLNHNLAKLGKRYSTFLADSEESCKILAALLKNMEIIEKAVDQICSLSTDVEDSVGGDERIKPCMDKILEGFSELSEIMSDATLAVMASQTDSNGEVEVDSCDVIPNFDRCRNISCTSTIEAHNENINAMESFNLNNNTYIATGSDDSTIRVWDASDQSLLSTLEGHEEPVTSLATYEKDGIVHIASGSDDCTVRLWEMKDGQCVGVLNGHDDSIFSVATYVNNGAPYLCSASFDETIKCWSLDDHSLVRTIENEENTVDILQVSNANAFEVFHCEGEPFLASEKNVKSVNIRSLEDYDLVCNLKGKHIGRVHSFAPFSYENNPVLAVGSDTISLWDMMSYNFIGELAMEDELEDIHALKVVLCKGEVCLVSCSRDSTVVIWNVKQQKVLKTIKTGDEGVNLLAMTVLSINGKGCIAIADSEGAIKLYME